VEDQSVIATNLQESLSEIGYDVIDRVASDCLLHGVRPRVPTHTKSDQPTLELATSAMCAGGVIARQGTRGYSPVRACSRHREECLVGVEERA